MRPKDFTIDSEPIRARGIIVKYTPYIHRVGYNHLISTSASGISFLLKTSTKYREFLPDFICKKQPILSLFLILSRRVHIIFGEHGGSYAMMAKPIRALELHYLMIHLKRLTNGGAYIRGGLYIFVRGFRRAYKRRDLYPRGLIHLRKGFLKGL